MPDPPPNAVERAREEQRAGHVKFRNFHQAKMELNSRSSQRITTCMDAKASVFVVWSKLAKKFPIRPDCEPKQHNIGCPAQSGFSLGHAVYPDVPQLLQPHGRLGIVYRRDKIHWYGRSRECISFVWFDRVRDMLVPRRTGQVEVHQLLREYHH